MMSGTKATRITLWAKSQWANPKWSTTSKSADTIATRRLPTCYRFTINGYSEIDPAAVVVAEIPVVAETTEGDKGASGLKLCDYTKIHKVHLKKEM